MEDFSSRLKELRAARGLSQRAVADAAGIHTRGYQHYELGEREPAFKPLLALADFFDVSLDYLVGRTDDPTRPPPAGPE